MLGAIESLIGGRGEAHSKAPQRGVYTLEQLEPRLLLNADFVEIEPEVDWSIPSGELAVIIDLDRKRVDLQYGQPQIVIVAPTDPVQSDETSVDSRAGGEDILSTKIQSTDEVVQRAQVDDPVDTNAGAESISSLVSLSQVVSAVEAECFASDTILQAETAGPIVGDPQEITHVSDHSSVEIRGPPPEDVSSSPDQLIETLRAPYGPSIQPDRQIVFVDPSVPDSEILLAGLLPGSNAGTRVVYLDAGRDGVQQITDVMAGSRDISALHIFSHGSAGSLSLGNAQLSGDNLDQYTGQLRAWGSALTADADLLLYGCNVAAGEEGAAFVQRLSEMTGADVAASTNATGSGDLGGDWVLELASGAIATEYFLTQNQLELYKFLLDTKTVQATSTPETFTINETSVETLNQVTNFASADDLTVEGSSGNDTFTINQFPIAKTTKLDGGKGSDTLNFSALDKPLVFMLRNGSIIVEAGYDGGNRSITATHIENLVGGRGDDSFVFRQDATPLEGYIDGGGGANILNYAAYTSDVNVDLTTNVTSQPSGQSGFKRATNITKGVKNILNVVGGSGKNTLTGDEKDNTLTGGKESDVLKGMGGNDLLRGLASTDILIGGPGEDVLEGGEGNDIYKFALADFPDPIAENSKDTIIEGSGPNDGNLDTLDFSAFPVNANGDIALTFSVNSNSIEVSLKCGNTDKGFLFTSAAPNVEGVFFSQGSNDFKLKNNWVKNLRISVSENQANPSGKVKLDCSAVVGDLLFDVGQDGKVTIKEATLASTGQLEAKQDGSTVTAANVRDLVGGKGNNTYKFIKGGALAGTLTGGPPGQPPGKINVLDYSQYDQAVSVNLTGASVAFDTGVHAGPAPAGGEINKPGPVLPIQERWVYSIPVVKGELILKPKTGESKPFAFSQDEDKRELYEQQFKQALAGLLQRNDFTVDKRDFEASTEWTVKFAEPGPIPPPTAGIPDCVVGTHTCFKWDDPSKGGRIAIDRTWDVYTNATGGSFKLGFKFSDKVGQTVEAMATDIKFNDTPDIVKAKMEEAIKDRLDALARDQKLAQLDAAPQVLVTGMGTAEFPWRITFANMGDVQEVQGTGSPLTNRPNPIPANWASGLRIAPPGTVSDITQVVGSGQNDLIYGTSLVGKFQADGKDGADTLISYVTHPDAEVAKRVNILNGGGDADVIAGGDGADTIDGGIGEDTIYGDGSHTGGAAANGARDVVRGGEGNDRLYGNEGNDTLSGGPDGDFLVGGPGSDVVQGERGDDILAVIEGGQATDYDQLLGGDDSDQYRFAGTWGVASIGERGDEGTDSIDLSKMSGNYVHVLSNGTLYSTHGDLYGNTITPAGAGQSAIKLNTDLEKLQGAVKSPGQIVTEVGFGLHQIGVSDAQFGATITAWAALPKVKNDENIEVIRLTGDLNFLLWVDWGDGVIVRPVTLEKGDYSTAAAVADTLSQKLNVPQISVKVVKIGLLGGDGLQITATPAVSCQARMELAVKARNTVVAGLGDGTGFENVEVIKPGSGANTFVFGNDYWHKDFFGSIPTWASFADAIKGLLNPFNTGAWANKGLKIDTSAIVSNEPGKGQPLIIDLRAVNTQLEFYFSKAEKGAGVKLTIKTVFDANIPVIDMGPVFRYNSVEFTNVGNDTIVRTGRFNNTIIIEEGVTFEGALLASEGYGLSAVALAGRWLDCVLWGLDAAAQAYFNHSDIAADVNTLLVQVKNTVKYSQTSWHTSTNLEALKKQTYSATQRALLEGANVLTLNWTSLLDLIGPLAQTSGFKALTTNLGREMSSQVIVKTGFHFVRGHDWDPFNKVGDIWRGGVTELPFQLATTLLSGSDTISVGDSIASVTPGLHLLAGGSGADTYKFRTQWWGGALILEPPSLTFDGSFFEGNPYLEVAFNALGTASNTLLADTLDFSAMYQDFYFTVFEVSTRNIGFLSQIVDWFGESVGADLAGSSPVNLGMTITLVTNEDPYESNFLRQLLPFLDDEFAKENPSSGSFGDLFDTSLANVNFAVALGIEKIIGGRGSNTVKLVNGAKLEGSVSAGFGGGVNLDYSRFGTGTGLQSVDLGANLVPFPVT